MQNEADADVQQVPFADAPCDATGCTKPWVERVEWYYGSTRHVVRFACEEHADQYLLIASEFLPGPA